MHEKLNLSTGSPIKIKWCDYDYFKYPWHTHTEYEIVYIIKSTGKRFTGNTIESYSDGDLVLLGSFLPHMYRSDDVYYQNDPNYRVYAIILQFAKDLFSHAIQNYPEFHKIKLLLKEAKYGVYFNKSSNDAIRKEMHRALELKDLDLIIQCIKILSLMGDTKEKRLLSDENIENETRYQNDDVRLTKILEFLNDKYSHPLSLKEISDFSGMNETAFCRYFKEKTSKSCFQYINELRVTYACKLLLEGKMSVSQVCYESGFNNISNFNRQFKNITHYSPSEYLKEFKKRTKSHQYSD
jgi:AraC-type DNA-binding domain-containing proteins